MDLNILTFEELILVDAPRGVCLYGKDSRSQIKELIELGSRLQSSEKTDKILPRAVVLFQSQNANDFVPSWTDELKKDGLQRQTYEHLLEFRWLLYLVRHSVVPWYYISANDVLGSHWELALSCQFRYSLNYKARFGFPEISTGQFIPGGVLESLSKRGIKVKEKWQSQNTFDCTQAFRDGLIHCSFQSIWPYDSNSNQTVGDPSVQKFLSEMLKSRLQGTERLGQRNFAQMSSRVVSNTLDLFLRRSLPPKFTQIDQVTKDQLYHLVEQKVDQFVYLSQKTNLTPWEFCWSLVHERTHAQKPLEIAAGIARISALGFYNSRYINWLSSQRNTLRTLKSRSYFKSTKDQATPFNIAIDITEGYPPIEAISALAETQPITLQGQLPSADFLQALEILYTRLDRSLGHAEAQRIWGKRVLWSQGLIHSERFMTAKWISFERLSLQFGQNHPVHFRAIGIDFSGIKRCSLVGEEETFSVELEDILERVSSKVILLRAPTSRIPWEAIVRSLVLQEIIELARLSGGDLSKVCENLRKNGWSFVSDEEFWHYFLKSPEDLTCYQTGVNELDKMIQANNQYLWEVGSWKQARALARKESEELLTNPVMQSRQLAFFVGMITGYVAKASPPDLKEETDYLARESIGFPTQFESPLIYLESLGLRREKSLRASYEERFGI